MENIKRRRVDEFRLLDQLPAVLLTHVLSFVHLLDLLSSFNGAWNKGIVASIRSAPRLATHLVLDSRWDALIGSLYRAGKFAAVMHQVYSPGRVRSLVFHTSMPASFCRDVVKTFGSVTHLQARQPGAGLKRDGIKELLSLPKLQSISVKAFKLTARFAMIICSNDLESIVIRGMSFDTLLSPTADCSRVHTAHIQLLPQNVALVLNRMPALTNLDLVLETSGESAIPPVVRAIADKSPLLRELSIATFKPILASIHTAWRPLFQLSQLQSVNFPKIKMTTAETWEEMLEAVDGYGQDEEKMAHVWPHLRDVDTAFPISDDFFERSPTAWPKLEGVHLQHFPRHVSKFLNFLECHPRCRLWLSESGWILPRNKLLAGVLDQMFTRAEVIYLVNSALGLLSPVIPLWTRYPKIVIVLESRHGDEIDLGSLFDDCKDCTLGWTDLEIWTPGNGKFRDLAAGLKRCLQFCPKLQRLKVACVHDLLGHYHEPLYRSLEKLSRVMDFSIRNEGFCDDLDALSPDTLPTDRAVNILWARRQISKNCLCHILVARISDEWPQLL